MPPRPVTSYAVIVAIGLATFLLFSTSSRRAASDAVESIHIPDAVQAKLPSLDDISATRFSFYKSTHRPPEQPNSTASDTAWFSDWRWLNPFSSSVTLDEERAVLPPLPSRPPVYTYYDTTLFVDQELALAHGQLLTTWKRAWWAHGFRPIVLTQAEAMRNPLSAMLHSKGMPAVLEAQFWKWLAWGHMGSGLLADWYCVPMIGDIDPTITFLRRGEYDKLIKFDGLSSGLFAGDKGQINAAVEEALNDVKLSTHKEITNAINERHFRTESASALAYYNVPTISLRYPKLLKLMQEKPIVGTKALNQLINAHLHTIWQNTYSQGIAILKPLPAHTSELVKPGTRLANLLTECPESFLQSSCPPNRLRCSPCVNTKIQTYMGESFKNTSDMFTIATIPHPYTLISLNSLLADPSIAHIRRNTDRDPWLRSVTRYILGDGRGGPARVVGLKDAIASEYSRRKGIWFTVEHFPAEFNPPPAKPKSPTNNMHPEREKIAAFPEHWLEDLDWHFGFIIPRTAISHGESYSPIPGIRDVIKGIPESKKTSYDPPPSTYAQEQTEINILKRSRETIKSKDKHTRQMREVAEAWNLADTEIWRFARAYWARNNMERKRWEEEEAGYGGSGVPRGTRWWS